MDTKTPKFDKAIREILDGMVPHKRNCVQCSSEFDILDDDIDFFNKFKVPPHIMCPQCRRQNRLAFLNYTTLFRRPCDVFGHDENVISSIPEGTKFKVFDFDFYWHGDRNWRDGAQDYDTNEKFIIQFQKLFFNSPQPALTRDPASIESTYTSYGIQLKDCYYTFGGMNAENVMFSIWPMYTKDSMDMLISVNTNTCYEGVYPENCYNCKFVYFSKNCIDCNFVFDCRNCSDCFGCVNLRNKKYCIWNEQYTKEEYFEKISKINLGNSDELSNYKKYFFDFIKSLPVRALRNENSQNISGNYLINCKNTLNSSWVMDSENVRFSDFALKLKDSYDCATGAMSEKLYSTAGVGVHSFDVKFSVLGRDLRECEYVMNCKKSQNCFGCIGLENVKFCIFNKQYEENKYWEMVDEIKTRMLENNEYGNFFPYSVSPFPYNATMANILFNISKEEALKLDSWWFDEKKDFSEDLNFIKYDQINVDVKNITDEILNNIIISTGNGKPFRIIKKELDYYKQKNIAIPSFTPYERIVSRFGFVNNFKIFKDKCFKCGIEILSSYDSSDGYKPYCEQCYQKEIY